MWTFVKLGGWVIIWSILWFFFLPFRKGRHNCLTWAVDKWDTEGGYLVIRWSRSNKKQWLKWPHFLWMSEKEYKRVEHLIPFPEDEAKHTVPRPWFDGRHAKADPKGQGEN